MPFTLTKYRLDYAVWAAYRAAQAGSAKARGPEFSEALKNCGVIAYVDSYSKKELSEKEVSEKDFDDLHKKWCHSIINTVKCRYKKEISYGIAAKLINVFLKGYFMLLGNEETSLGLVIHLPIDSSLLKGIDKEKNTKLDKKYKWQKLDEQQYFELIEIFKVKIIPNEPLWKI